MVFGDDGRFGGGQSQITRTYENEKCMRFMVCLSKLPHAYTWSVYCIDLTATSSGNMEPIQWLERWHP